MRLLLVSTTYQCADCHIYAFVALSLLASLKAPYLWEVSDSSQQFQKHSYFSGRSFPTCIVLHLSPNHTLLPFQAACERLHARSLCMYTPFACLGAFWMVHNHKNTPCLLWQELYLQSEMLESCKPRKQVWKPCMSSCMEAGNGDYCTYGSQACPSRLTPGTFLYTGEAFLRRLSCFNTVILTI